MKRLSDDDKEDYVGSLIIRGHQCDFYSDDCGQCFYFKYLNQNNEIEEIGCGTYNSNYIEEAVVMFDTKGL